MIQYIAIADKYNLIELYNTLDSHLAQCVLFGGQKISFIALKNILAFVNKFGAPKTAAAISHLKMKNEDTSVITDEQWSALVNSYPYFATVSTKVICRKDYQMWMKQHDNWFLPYLGGMTMIVGPPGEMKGAINCAPI